MQAIIALALPLSSDYLNIAPLLDYSTDNWNAMPDQAVKGALFDQFARIGKALASGRRIEMLDVLANGERTVEALADQVHLTLANTSQHLQTLRDAGLVSSHREGTFIRYALATPQVFELWTLLRSLSANQLADVERLVEAYVGSHNGLEPVSRKELLKRLRSGERLVVLDVRPKDEFDAGHLPGAVSIPLAELERRLKQVPKDQPVVAYCRGPYCALAPAAVRVLNRRGYQARELEDGFPEWSAAGLPVERNNNGHAQVGRHKPNK
jgi:rhodanese-related sulfurtransferase/DNA-binding transcriptional ArsR family regulator